MWELGGNAPGPASAKVLGQHVPGALAGWLESRFGECALETHIWELQAPTQAAVTASAHQAASVTEVHGLMVLEAGSPRLRCRQNFRRPLPCALVPGASPPEAVVLMQSRHLLAGDR